MAEKPAVREVSLGYALIDRVWFGDDTMTARLGNKYKEMKAGEKIEFTPRNEDGETAARIPSELTEVRKIKFKDILTLPSAELKQAGADSARDLYDSQFDWYGDNINDETEFYLLFYKQPSVAQDLQYVRSNISDAFSKFSQENQIKTDIRFSYENEFDFGDGVKTPACIVTLGFDGNMKAFKKLTQFTEDLNAKIGDIETDDKRYTLTLLIPKSPADIRAKLEPKEKQSPENKPTKQKKPGFNP